MTLRRSTSPRLRHRSGEGQRSPPVEPSGFTTHVLSMQERACSHGIAPSHLVPPTSSGRGRAGNDVGRFVDAPRLSEQGRAQPQDIVSPRLTPPAPSKRGRGNVQRRRVIPFHPARSIRTERCMRTRHCAVSLNPTRFIEVGKGSVHRLSSRQALPRLRYLCREGRAHMTLSLTPHPACPVRTGKSMARPAAWHIQSPRLLRGLCKNSIQLFSRGSLASSGKDHFHNWKEQSCLSVRMDTSPSENLNFSAQLSIQERTRQAMCSVPASKWYNGIAS